MSEGPPGTSHALVRPAARDDIPALVVLARRAFINDPFTNYCGDLKEALSNDVSTPKRQHLEIFYRMLFGAIIHSGGRVMVVAVPIPPKSDNGQSTGAERKRNRRRDKIAAVAAWLPPHVRIGLDHPWALLRSGLVGAVRRWGLKGAHRAGIEYGSKVEKAFEEIYKARGVKETERDAWYLQLAATEPDEQGKGYLSLLVREAFAHTPNATFVLEATTEKSRDRYDHFGFQLERPIVFGKGEFDSNGYRAKGESAEGFQIYAMVKWTGS